MELEDEFYVTLVSDESGDFDINASKFPAAFTNKLPTPLLFKEPYVVALTEIYLPEFEVQRSQDTNYKRYRRNTPKDFEIHLRSGLNWNIKISSEFFDPDGLFTLRFQELLPLCIVYLDKQNFVSLDNVVIDSFSEKLAKVMEEIDFNQKYETFKPIDSDSNTFILEFPIEKVVENGIVSYKSHDVTVEIMKYDSLKDFFNYIVRQVPVKDRHLDVILENLSFDDKDPIFQPQYKTAIEKFKKLFQKVQQKFNIKNVPTPSDSSINPLDKSSSLSNNPPTQVPSNKLAEVQTKPLDDSLQLPAPSNNSFILPENQQANTSVKPVNVPPQSQDEQVGDISFIYVPLRKQIQMLFVYTDIVNSHTYASKHLKLLRIIPHYNTSSDGIHLTFDSPEFYPVSKTYFEDISILISNRGKSVHLKSGVQPIYVQLLFRRKYK